MKNNWKYIIIILLIISIGINIFLIWSNKSSINFDEIERLNTENKLLQLRIDSLDVINKKIIKQREQLVEERIKLEANVDSLEQKIKTLKNKDDEIIDNVDNLTINGVTSEFSKYLQRKGSNIRR